MGKAEGGGPGWVILAYSPRDKRLVNQWAADHATTLAGGRPVLVLDMYEHAYHMDYGVREVAVRDGRVQWARWLRERLGGGCSVGIGISFASLQEVLGRGSKEELVSSTRWALQPERDAGCA
jgi:hypothetical protein